MMARRVVEVAPTKGPQSGWDVKVRGQGGRQHFETKPPAVDAAKTIAKAAPLGQVVVKKENGRVQTEYTYGQDPRRYKG
jgi:hypothetical protein